MNGGNPGDYSVGRSEIKNIAQAVYSLKLGVKAFVGSVKVISDDRCEMMIVRSGLAVGLINLLECGKSAVLRIIVRLNNLFPDFECACFIIDNRIFLARENPNRGALCSLDCIGGRGNGGSKRECAGEEIRESLKHVPAHSATGR